MSILARTMAKEEAVKLSLKKIKTFLSAASGQKY